jgi:hypothetical protein
MLLLERHHGSGPLAARLRELIRSLEALEGPETADAQWWAAHLLGETLDRVPDIGAYSGVLRELAEAVTARSLRAGGPRGLGGLGRFGPWFWERQAVDRAEQIDLLRVLVLADGAPEGVAAGEERYLDAVVRLLLEDVRRVQVLLCGWFDDARVLPGGAGATVAEVAQALLHTHRGAAVDDLVEALVEAAHPRADELLHALAADEPAALCRAIARWAHDDRVERRVAAASYGLVAAPHAAAEADRELLRRAASALLARTADTSLHGRALALLVQDPRTRSHHLPRALAAFEAGEPGVPAAALAAALTTHPEQVLAALGTGLHDTDARAQEVLRALAGVDTPALARRAAALVAAYVRRRPGGAVHAAGFVEARLRSGPAARAVLLPLVSDMLRGSSARVRSVLANVLAAPGCPDHEPLRAELLDVLLRYEEHLRDDPARGRDPAVPEAVLRAAALGAGRRSRARTRELVRRAGTLLVRTPEGASRFEGRLVALAREAPGFARLVADWTAAAPGEWAALVGPGARSTVRALAAAETRERKDGAPMRAAGRGHGSLRPA